MLTLSWIWICSRMTYTSRSGIVDLELRNTTDQQLTFKLWQSLNLLIHTNAKFTRCARIRSQGEIKTRSSRSIVCGPQPAPMCLND